MKFQRGYKKVQEKLNGSNPYLRSCFNCAYFYQTEFDNEEMCQNPNVVKYDMVQNGNDIYCLKWKPCTKKEKEKMFRRGRDLL